MPAGVAGADPPSVVGSSSGLCKEEPLVQEYDHDPKIVGTAVSGSG